VSEVLPTPRWLDRRKDDNKSDLLNKQNDEYMKESQEARACPRRLLKRLDAVERSPWRFQRDQ